MLIIKINCWRCSRELDILPDQEEVFCGTCGGRAYKIKRDGSIINITRYKRETVHKVKCSFCGNEFESYIVDDFNICGDCYEKDSWSYFDFCLKRLGIKKLSCPICNNELTKDTLEYYELDEIEFFCKHCNSHIRIKSSKIYDYEDEMYEI